MYEDRIRNKKMIEKLMTAEQAASLVKTGMCLGCSGFTQAGYPKAVPRAIASQGVAKNLTLITGASTGDALDGVLAEAGLVGRRYPFQSNSTLRNQINQGQAYFSDLHLGQLPQYICSGLLGKMDFAIIECCAITKDGGLVPTTSVGASPAMALYADQIIVEINLAKPMELYGMHDIYMENRVPDRKEIPIYHSGDKIGSPAIFCDIDKIAAVVISDEEDKSVDFTVPDENSRRIAAHIIGFLEKEIKVGRLPKNLPPIQSGVGSVANAVLSGLKESRFENMTMYTEVIQDSAMELIETGKFIQASATAVSLSKNRQNNLYKNLDFYKKHIVLRPQDLSNHPEVIRRLGVIALNTAVEVDLYGNVNSTNAFGSRMINGIGGSGDFARNAGIAIFSTVSTAKHGDISSIVPMVAHVDHVEHDVGVVVTEQGLADLRGKSPRERAELIIDRCCHPDYKSELRDYYRCALKGSYALHTPIVLEQALSWHDRYLKTGSMKV